MTFTQAIKPLSNLSDEYDTYLEKGWFRMGQEMFTICFLRLNSIYSSAVWLRISMESYVANSNHRRVFAKNADFKVEVKPLVLDQSKEELYQLYKNSISFQTSNSLQELLYESENENEIFNSLEMSIYNGETLIACGIFDVGKNAAAGICNFYNPDFKSNSLGNFLIYKKLEYCKNIGLEFFYPGYFTPDNPVFNYKLSFAKQGSQFLDVVQNKWLPFQNFTYTNNTLSETKQMLDMLKTELGFWKIQGFVCYYRNFELNIYLKKYFDYLFDFPMFIHIPKYDDIDFLVVITYHFITKKYMLIKCNSVLFLETDESPEKEFSFRVLQFTELLIETDSPMDMIHFLM